MTPTEPDPRLGRYRLVRRLGAGGMGVVWEAVLEGPEGFRRPVALKLLDRRAATEAGRRALVHEARLGAMLSHPNVVGTLEVGEVDGQWFMAMELVHGPTLRQLATPLAATAVVDIGLQACAGLAHLHGMDLLHRDIKAGNLLVDRSGVVKIADLGIARLASASAEAAGTLGYAPPEQLEGLEDARADLFSLGVLLTRLVLGRMPFGTGRAAMLTVARADEIAASALSQLEERALADVLARCLRREPAERWTSAIELGNALRAVRGVLSPGPTLLEVLAHQRPDLVVPTFTGPSTTQPPTDTLLLTPGNLPRRADRYVGRSAERARLKELLTGDGRLVTLLGLGGVGKTRLAIEAASRVAPDFAGGAWFCDLSAATDEAGVVAGVAGALGVPDAREGAALDRVGHALRARGRVLVVLDNLEQVVAGAAAAVSRWLALAPECTFVATSRIALQLRGEQLLALGPLATPEAVRLFELRAARPPEPQQRDEVEALVSALDGLPLAIELAAARTRVLPVATIRERLNERFRLLAGGGRDRPERHRSLRASLDGSWELLGEPEQRALAQLSVFVDGFTLEAAEAVLDPGDSGAWAIDLVEALVDHSLVRYDRGARRFLMLVMVREYAAQKLAPAERAAAEARHVAWFACFGAEEALDALAGPDAAATLRRMCDDRENLLVACERATGAAAVALLRAAWVVLELQGPPERAIELARRVSSLELHPVDRARALLVEARALGHRFALPQAEEVFRAAVEAARAADAPIELGRALSGLGRAVREQGRLDEGMALYRAAADALRRGGLVAEAEATAAKAAYVLHGRGRLDEAYALFEAALRAAEARGDLRLQATLHNNLGGVHHSRGEARRYLERNWRALELARLLGDRWREGQLIANIAQGHALLGEHDEALRLYDLARTLHGEVGDRRAEANLRSNLAFEHERVGRLDLARQNFEASIALFQEIGAVADVAKMLGNLAIIHRAQGDLDGALRLLREALESYRRLGNRRGEGVVLGNLGLFVGDAGRLDEAIEHLQAAIGIHREVGNRRSEGRAVGNLGFVLQKAGDLDRAEARYVEALAIHREVGNVASEATVLKNLGTIAHERGDEAAARRWLLEAEVGFERSSHFDKLASTRATLAEMALESGDVEEARRWLDAADEATGRLPEDAEVTREVTSLRQKLGP